MCVGCDSECELCVSSFCGAQVVSVCEVHSHMCSTWSSGHEFLLVEPSELASWVRVPGPPSAGSLLCSMNSAFLLPSWLTFL